MADIIWTDITSMFPADVVLAGLPSAAQDNILAFVNTSLSAGYFGGADSAKYKLARIYYAAHLGVTGGAGSAGAAGPVIARSEGGVSESYANIGTIALGASAATTYGRLFYELVMSSPRRAGLST